MPEHLSPVCANYDVNRHFPSILAFMNTSPNTLNPWPTPPINRYEAIRRRAEEIYIRNGRIPGHDLDNWAQAEREITLEAAARRRTAVVVRVNGTEFVGEYDPATDGYMRGEFLPHAAVSVHFHGNKMFILRPNGKVLETTIIKTGVGSASASQAFGK
jgi:hypothetical protein